MKIFFKGGGEERLEEGLSNFLTVRTLPRCLSDELIVCYSCKCPFARGRAVCFCPAAAQEG